MTDDTNIHLLQAIWSAGLSLLGGLAVWNWNRLNKQVDAKADKSEVTQLRQDLQDRWAQQDKLNQDRDDRQEQQHRENRSRMDAIYNMLANNGRVGQRRQ